MRSRIAALRWDVEEVKRRAKSDFQTGDFCCDD